MNEISNANARLNGRLKGIEPLEKFFINALLTSPFIKKGNETWKEIIVHLRAKRYIRNDRSSLRITARQGRWRISLASEREREESRESRRVVVARGIKDKV